MRPSQTWFIADLHFGHKAVIEYENRPFDNVDHMNEQLIYNWNSMVMDHDLVYVLGDFSFMNPSKTEDIARRLLGRKILIRGNHDGLTNSRYMSMGFAAVAEQMIIELAKDVRVKLCHYPYLFNNPDEDQRYKNLRPMKERMWLVHGHIHSTIKPIDHSLRTICVSIENFHYRPVNSELITSIVRKDNEYYHSID